jgi:CDP-diacylglycerol--glycerol-3-phosphate 3-phosphatidyltransferase
MTSYARARAESLIPKCKVGFMERPERIVLLVIGGLANRMEAVLWVLAVLGNWTVFNRIYYTWRELPSRKSKLASVEAAKSAAVEVRDPVRKTLEFRGQAP